MKLIQAIQLAKKIDLTAADVKRGFVACGFTAMHLETFLKAETLAQHGLSVDLRSGVFDDLGGNVHRLSSERFDYGYVVVEWSDLDPRLGIRVSSRYHPELTDDIRGVVQQRLDYLENEIQRAAANGLLVVSLPSLPLHCPVPTRRPQAHAFSFELTSLVNQFAAAISSLHGVRVLDPSFMNGLALQGDRHDVREQLRSGFPYKLPYCAELASQLVTLASVPAPKKALITDLDNTFWRGVVGDDGTDAVSWSLDQNSQSHALYQQLLGTLAANGILLAVASKNDKDVAVQAMNREDALIAADEFFPLEIHWDAKSLSVGRILEAWNIGPADVVFVDDSSLELSEVSSAWPELTCMQFPMNDERKVVGLLNQLSDLFSKESVREEDRLRAQSIRANATFQERRKVDPEELLKGLHAKISLSIDQPDMRCLELINKTNQFNLNGRRITESNWQQYSQGDDAFVVSAKYEDQFGLLGTIAVVAGTIHDKTQLRIDHWVMSCRAFSRRIEFQVLLAIFEEFNPTSLELDFQATDRNGPFQQFLEIVADESLDSPPRVSRDAIQTKLPPLYGKVTIV